MPRLYPLLGFFAATSSCCCSIRSVSRCATVFAASLRFKRIWLTFVAARIRLFRFSILHFHADSKQRRCRSQPAHFDGELALADASSRFGRKRRLPALEGVAGIFDNATTTYPLSAIAAVLMLMNWRGLARRAGPRVAQTVSLLAVILIYLILLFSAVAALLKPIVFWRLPLVGRTSSGSRDFCRSRRAIDAVAFIFEYLLRRLHPGLSDHGLLRLDPRA